MPYIEGTAWLGTAWTVSGEGRLLGAGYKAFFIQNLGPATFSGGNLQMGFINDGTAYMGTIDGTSFSSLNVNAWAIANIGPLAYPYWRIGAFTGNGTTWIKYIWNY